MPAGYASQTGYQYDSISRVAGQREPAPPSKFSNEGGFKNSVFNGILGASILALLHTHTPQVALPFRYVFGRVESVETFVQVCLSGGQTAKEPRRTPFLRIETQESGSGWHKFVWWRGSAPPRRAEPRLHTITSGLLKPRLAAPISPSLRWLAAGSCGPADIRNRHPGKAENVRPPARAHRPIRARCRSWRRSSFAPLPGPTVQADIPTPPLHGQPRVARRRAAA